MRHDRERFWSAVDSALDARRDPCEDALVQEWMADHPADGEELARLVRRLGAVAVAAPASRPLAPTHSERRIALPIMAAAAVVVLGVHLSIPTRTKDSSPHRLPSRVVSFSIEVTRESDGAITTVVTDPNHTERSHISRLGSTVIASRLESRIP
jgi:hypothetical protein